MTYEEAIIWAQSMRDGIITIPNSDSYYGRDAAWGLYTENQEDALALAMGLGTIDTIDEVPGTYPHYHILNDDGERGFGKYKHFHIWYGDIIPIEGAL